MATDKKIVIEISAQDDASGKFTIAAKNIEASSKRMVTSLQRDAATGASAYDGLWKKMTGAASFTYLADTARRMGGAIIGEFDKILDKADELKGLSNQFGIPVESLQLLKYAAEQTEMSFEELAKTINFMEKNIGQADPTGKLTQDFNDLGLSIQKLKQMAPEDAFTAILKALEGMPNQYDRARIAADIFGKSGTVVNRILAEGVDQFSALQQKAKDFKIYLSADEINKLDAAGDALGTLATQYDALKSKLLIAFTPVLLAQIDALTEKLTRFTKEPYLVTVQVAFQIAGGTIKALLYDLPKKLGEELANKVATAITGVKTDWDAKAFTRRSQVEKNKPKPEINPEGTNLPTVDTTAAASVKSYTDYLAELNKELAAVSGSDLTKALATINYKWDEYIQKLGEAKNLTTAQSAELTSLANAVRKTALENDRYKQTLEELNKIYLPAIEQDEEWRKKNEQSVQSQIESLNELYSQWENLTEIQREYVNSAAQSLMQPGAQPLPVEDLKKVTTEVDKQKNQVEDSYREMNGFFKDLFVNAMAEDLNSFEDFFKRIMNKMKSAFADMIAGMVSDWLTGIGKMKSGSGGGGSLLNGVTNLFGMAKSTGGGIGVASGGNVGASAAGNVGASAGAMGSSMATSAVLASVPIIIEGAINAGKNQRSFSYQLYNFVMLGINKIWERKPKSEAQQIGEQYAKAFAKGFKKITGALSPFNFSGEEIGGMKTWQFANKYKDEMKHWIKDLAKMVNDFSGEVSKAVFGGITSGVDNATAAAATEDFSKTLAKGMMTEISKTFESRISYFIKLITVPVVQVFEDTWQIFEIYFQRFGKEGGSLFGTIGTFYQAFIQLYSKIESIIFGVSSTVAISIGKIFDNVFNTVTSFFSKVFKIKVDVDSSFFSKLGADIGQIFSFALTLGLQGIILGGMTGVIVGSVKLAERLFGPFITRMSAFIRGLEKALDIQPDWLKEMENAGLALSDAFDSVDVEKMKELWGSFKGIIKEAFSAGFKSATVSSGWYNFERTFRQGMSDWIVDGIIGGLGTALITVNALAPFFENIVKMFKDALKGQLNLEDLADFGKGIGEGLGQWLKDNKDIIREIIGIGQDIKKDFRGYATGTDYVPKTGVYMLHKGEKVIPANKNTAGGNTINITVNAQMNNDTDVKSTARRLGWYLEQELRGVSGY